MFVVEAVEGGANVLSHPVFDWDIALCECDVRVSITDVNIRTSNDNIIYVRIS